MAIGIFNEFQSYLINNYNLYILLKYLFYLYLVVYIINISLGIKNNYHSFNIKHIFKPHIKWKILLYKSLKRKRKFKKIYLTFRYIFYASTFIITYIILYYIYLEPKFNKFDKDEIGIVIANFREEKITNQFFSNYNDILYEQIENSFEESIFNNIKVKKTNKFFKNEKSAINWANKYNAYYIIWGTKGKEFYTGKEQIYAYFYSPFNVGVIFDDIEERLDFKLCNIKGILDLDKYHRILPVAQIKSYIYETIGFIAYMNNNFDKVIELFEAFPFHYKKIKNEVRYVRILFLLAMSYYYEENSKKSKDTFLYMNDFIEKNKYENYEILQSIALGNAGSLLLEEDNLDSAQVFLKKSLFYNKNNYFSIYKLASVYYYKDKHQEAVNLYKKLPEKHSLYKDALESIFRSFYQMGKYDSTLFYLNKYYSIEMNIPKDIKHSLLPMLLFEMDIKNQYLEIIYEKSFDIIELYIIEESDELKYKNDIPNANKKKILSLDSVTIEKIKKQKEIDAKCYYACLLFIEKMDELGEIQKRKEILTILHNKEIIFDISEKFKSPELFEYVRLELKNKYLSLKDSLDIK